jgi:hypothetical protein
VSETGVPEVADDAALYAIVPDQFVAARDALVRRLRTRGDKAEAARVAKLRRPPPTTWALNQVARHTPALIEGLLGAGAVLRSAMEKALRGDASELRQARASERSAVDAIVDDAGRRLDDAGHTPTDVMNQRMAATLRAAIVDDSVADLLQRGMLDRDRDAPGFGMDSLAAPLRLVPTATVAEGAAAEDELQQASAGDDQAGDDQAGDDQAAAAGADDAGAAKAALAERASRRQAAMAEADRLAAEAQAIEADADRLGSEADRLAAEAKAARDHADEARSRADAARQAADAQRAVAGHLSAASTESVAPPAK